MTKPIKAISLVQPWAWLIVQGIKDVENRTWHTKHTGTTLIHASKKRSHDDYDRAARVLAQHNQKHGTKCQLPLFNDLPRGGIVGTVDFFDCVDSSPSLWFFGPYGFTFTRPRVLPFTPCKGSLGFFVPDVEVTL